MNHLIANRYLLEAELARGAAGIVHRAVDQETGDKVAVKMLHAASAQQPDMATAFLDEAEVLSQLDHPGIVRPRDLIADGDTLALVMDLVDGRDLRRILSEDGPYAPARAAVLVAQVCEALAAVHAAGVVHGDVKPGNVLLAEPDGSPKLVDFGVSRRVANPQGPARGTPDYTAPEVVRGNASSAKSDMYGVGLLLYEAMCAVNPYRGGGVEEVLGRHCRMVPQRPPHIPSELWSVIDSCLSADPAQRPDAPVAASRLRAEAGAVSGEAVPALVGVPAMQLRETPVTAPPSDGVYVNPISMSLPSTSPTTGPPTTVAPPVLVPGMESHEPVPTDRPSRAGLWAGVAAGVVALVAVCVLWFTSVSSESPAQVQQGGEQSSQESEQPVEESESPDAGESEPTPSRSPSTDSEGPQSSRDSNEDSGARDNPGDGSDSPRSETDAPGNAPIGSPLPGRAGSN